MSDVSAVVLSMGEPFVDRALASLRSQTLPIEQIVRVEDVSPFFRALNEGAGRVATPYFLQVDADMVLDPACARELRDAVRDDVGMVVGKLRDDLMGDVVGVKLFRTACFHDAQFHDSVSPDTDFVAAIGRRGWKVRYLRQDGDVASHNTLGAHRPEYTPAYTFRKHLIEGARYRYRGARSGLLWRMDRLEQSTHPLRDLSLLALGHGFFLGSDRDELRPSPLDPRADQLLGVLAADHRDDAVVARLLSLDPNARLREVFLIAVRAGEALARSGAGATLRDALASLQSSGRDWRVAVARIGLGHGLLRQTSASLDEDTRVLRRFLTLGLGRHPTMAEHLRARAARMRDALAGRHRFGRW